MGAPARRRRALAADEPRARRVERPLEPRRPAPGPDRAGRRPSLRDRAGTQGTDADGSPSHPPRLPRRRERPRRATHAPLAGERARGSEAAPADERRLRRPSPGVGARRAANRVQRGSRARHHHPSAARAVVGGDGRRQAPDSPAGEPGRRRRPAELLAGRPKAGIHRHRRARPGRRGAPDGVGHGSPERAASAAHRIPRPAGRRLGVVRPDDGRGGARARLAGRRVDRRDHRRPWPKRPLPGRSRRGRRAARESRPPDRELRHRGGRRARRRQRRDRRPLRRGSRPGERDAARNHAGRIRLAAAVPGRRADGDRGGRAAPGRSTRGLHRRRVAAAGGCRPSSTSTAARPGLGARVARSTQSRCARPATAS